MNMVQHGKLKLWKREYTPERLCMGQGPAGRRRGNSSVVGECVMVFGRGQGELELVTFNGT